MVKVQFIYRFYKVFTSEALITLFFETRDLCEPSKGSMTF